MYALQVIFRSNERPWRDVYEPMRCHQPETDEAAVRWARDMERGLGEDYQVTLMKDGVPVQQSIS